MIPYWLDVLSIGALMLGAVSALTVFIDITRHPQHMWVMNLVWPISGLYAGPLALWGYVRFGRASPPHGGRGHGALDKPVYASVGIAATHCDAGCTLGDIVAEWLCFGVPAVAVWFGWHSIFGEKMFAVWVVDYVFAFIIGIVFQYFSIAPMRGLSFGEGIAAAVKADSLSLIAWQGGMYGFMALAQYLYFKPLLGKMLEVNTVEFWFTMQIAMLAGFVTSYPVNWWLIRVGVKEKM